MRKFWMAFVTFCLTATSSLTALAPANADVWQDYINIAVGEQVDLYAPCPSGQGTIVTQGYLPGDLQLDAATGHITGAAYEVVQYGIHLGCVDGQGYTISSDPIWVRVVASEKPFLSVTPLNDADCSVEINGYNGTESEGLLLTATSPDYFLRFEIPTSTFVGEHFSMVVSYDDLLSAHLSDGTPVPVFDHITDLPMDGSPVTIECGGPLSWQLSSWWRMADYLPIRDMMQVSDVISTRSNSSPPPTLVAPNLIVRPLNDANCTIDIVGYIPSLADAGSVILSADSGQGASANTVVLTNVVAGEQFHLYFPQYAISRIYAPSGAQIASVTTPQSPACGDETDFKLQYSSLGTVAPFATANNVVGATGAASAPFVEGGWPTAEPVFDGRDECTVTVTGRFPIASNNLPIRYVELFNNEIDSDLGLGTRYVRVIPQNIASDGTFTFHFGLTDNTSTDFSIMAPLDDRLAPSCGDTIAVQALYGTGDVETDKQGGFETWLPTHGVPTSCEPGSWSYNGQTPCDFAAPGYLVPFSGAQGQMPCGPGYYSESVGSIECEAAEPGFYVPMWGSSLQLPCPAGTFASDTGSSECDLVPVNHWSPPGAFEPTACDHGLQTEGTGANSPRECISLDALCEEGTWSLTGMAPCLQATPGYFVSTVGAQDQVRCEPGTFTTTFGNVVCTPAAPGSYVPDSGANKQESCPAGTFSANTRSFSCSDAPVGTYSRAGSSSITTCPVGTYTAGIGSTSPNDCLPLQIQKLVMKALPTGLKLKKSLVIPIVSDKGLTMTVTVSGKCSLVRVNGASVKIVAAKTKGTCALRISNAGGTGISPYLQTKNLKISKTGK